MPYEIFVLNGSKELELATKLDEETVLLEDDTTTSDELAPSTEDDTATAMLDDDLTPPTLEDVRVCAMDDIEPELTLAALDPPATELLSPLNDDDEVAPEELLGAVELSVQETSANDAAIARNA